MDSAKAVPEDALNSAIKACRAGTLSERSAAKKYNISRTTLHRRLMGIRPQKNGKWQTKFTGAEENFIGEIIRKCGRLGMPNWNKKLLKRIICRLLQAEGYTDKKQTCSEQWIQSFLNRNPEVAQLVPLRGLRRYYPTELNDSQQKMTGKWTSMFLKRHPEVYQSLPVSASSSSTNDQQDVSDDQSDTSHTVPPSTKRKKPDPGTVEQCEEWLACLSHLHTQGWLDTPDGLYIIDDTAFAVTDSTVDLYAKRKYSVTEEKREIITVLASGTAGGRLLRPLILYNENFNVREKFRGTEDKCWLGANDSGLLDGSVFLDYVQNEVLPSMNAEKNVIFVNAQMAEFLDEDFILECVQSDKTIRVVVLPAGHATRDQALDLRAFGPVKRHWKDFINGLSLTLSEGIDEQNFAARLMHQWDDFHMADTIVTAFTVTGICPYDPVVACQDFPVKKKPDPPKDYGPYIPPRQIYRNELEAAREALRRITGYTEIDVENIMAFVVNTLNEACNRTPSYTVSERPRKKRKTGK